MQIRVNEAETPRMFSRVGAQGSQRRDSSVVQDFLLLRGNPGKIVDRSPLAFRPDQTFRLPIASLPNGNFLFCHSQGAIEMTPEKKIVWEYKAAEGTQIHACQPLADGHVLVVENGPCRLLELDRNAKIAKEIKLTPPPAKISIHDQFRGVRKTVAGHYLVCRKGEHQVEELDGTGKSLRLIPVPGDVHEALLLPDGHLLVTCGDGHKVIELDQALKTVWELNENDVPGNPLRLMAGAQRLPNGNTVFCNYLGHGHLGEQPVFFEITRDKKVVWEFADHAHFKTINQIQLLDVKGDVTKGEILR